MKAQTQIERAVKACYDAYSDYARKVDGIPVIPSFPKVSWVRGSLKNENTGWLIDGRLYPGTAAQVIAHWDRLTDRWIARMRKKLAAPAVDAEPAQNESGGGGYGENG